MNGQWRVAFVRQLSSTLTDYARAPLKCCCATTRIPAPHDTFKPITAVKYMLGVRTAGTRDLTDITKLSWLCTSFVDEVTPLTYGRACYLRSTRGDQWAQDCISRFEWRMQNHCQPQSGIVVGVFVCGLRDLLAQLLCVIEPIAAIVPPDFCDFFRITACCTAQQLAMFWRTLLADNSI